MSETHKLHHLRIVLTSEDGQLARELSCTTTSFHYTPNHPQGRIMESGRGFQTEPAGKPHHLQRPAWSLASEWLHNTYIFFYWFHCTPVIREGKTVWGLYPPGYRLPRLSVLLMILRHQMGNSAWGNDPKRKCTEHYGKAWAHHESSLKPLWFGNCKFFFQGGNWSAEDTAYDPTVYE